MRGCMLPCRVPWVADRRASECTPELGGCSGLAGPFLRPHPTWVHRRRWGAFYHICELGRQPGPRKPSTRGCLHDARGTRIVSVRRSTRLCVPSPGAYRKVPGGECLVDKYHPTEELQLYDFPSEYFLRRNTEKDRYSREDPRGLITMGDAGPLGSTQTTSTATAMRQKTTPPKTKRAPRGKWNGRRVEGDGIFGAQQFL